jgi:hypothetical protein
MEMSQNLCNAAVVVHEDGECPAMLLGPLASARTRDARPAVRQSLPPAIPPWNCVQTRWWVRSPSSQLSPPGPALEGVGTPASLAYTVPNHDHNDSGLLRGPRGWCEGGAAKRAETARRRSRGLCWSRSQPWGLDEDPDVPPHGRLVPEALR